MKPKVLLNQLACLRYDCQVIRVSDAMHFTVVGFPGLDNTVVCPEVFPVFFFL